MASTALHDWFERLRMTADELRTRFQAECGAMSPASSGPSARCDRALRLSSLEPRLLFSATPIDPALLDGADQVATVLQVDLQPSAESEQQQSTNLFDQSSVQSASEIIVIDAAVPELQALLDDLATNRPGADVYVLNDQEDGVQQITRILEGRSGVSGIHLISHGENGSVRLGNTWLNAGNLDAYVAEIASWSDALTSDADLLLYGCDLAASENGRTLLSVLSVLTEADVAASDDDTGHARYGADWDLEYQTGAIETSIATSEAFQDSWQRKLATISVTTTADESSANGQTSLREAIQAATSGDTILLASGTYNLTIDSLEIDKDLTIMGSDARSTIIDASALNKRAITLKNDAVVAISRMTIQGGNENNGGGIFVDTDNTLYLSDAVLRSNTSDMGGAIHVHGTTHLNRVLLNNNTATSDGGAIHFHNEGTGSLTNVTISGNNASNDGGGVYADADIAIVNSTITLNSGQKGGGVFSRDGFITISNTIVANNNGNGSHADVTGNFVSDGSNLIKNGAGSSFGDDLTGVDPNLGTLTDNGGQIDTHGLLVGSPAIGAGNVTTSSTTDARGYLRGATNDIGASQFTAATLTSTNAFVVNTQTGSGANTNSQSRGSTSAIAADEAGNYVVVWTSPGGQDGSGDGVYGQRFDASGQKIGSEFRINSSTTEDQKWASVAMNASGTFVVTWTSTDHVTASTQVLARRFHASGMALGAEFRISDETAGEHYSSSVAIADDGRFAVVWATRPTSNSTGLYLRTFDSSGNEVGSKQTLDTKTSDVFGIRNPTISMLGDGRFVVAWERTGDVYVQRFTALGTAVGSSLKVSEASGLDSSSQPAVAMANDGSFVVAFTDGVLQLDINMQRFDAAGNETGGRIVVNTSSTGGTQWAPSIAMDDNGDFIVAWSGQGPGDTDGVFLQKFQSDGTPIGTITRINDVTAGNQTHVSLAMLNPDNFVVAWTGTEVFARQFGTASVVDTNQAPIGVNDTYEVNENSTLNSDSSWFDNDWQFRRTLSFDNSEQSASLTDFPVLIRLDASRIDYSQTQNAGQDLRFVDQNGNVLAHEIESWNESGSSYVWVKVPQIQAGSTTNSILMYYGNAAAGDGQNATNVWVGNTRAVYHLHNDFLDSTSNNNDGINSGSLDSTGRFGDGQLFDGVDDRITISSAASIDNVFSTGGTISVWFNPTSWGENQYGRLLDKSSGTTPSPNGWSLQVDGANESVLFEIGFMGSTGRWRADVGAVKLNEWQNVTVVYNASSSANNPQIYINGILQTLTESNTPTGAVHSDAGLALTIGNYQDTARTFDGLIDEVRVLNGTFSADWVAASMLSGKDQFVTFSTVQTVAGVLGNDIEPDSGPLNATLVGGNPANAKSFSFNSDGSFVYTPNDYFAGIDTFTYQASDGALDSNLVTVTITVNDINSAPTLTITPVTVTLPENTSTTTSIKVADVVINDDALGTNNLTLMGADAALFELQAGGTELHLRAGVVLDFETNPVLDVNVVVDDPGIGGTAEDTKAYALSITDSNEAATLTITPVIVTMPENTNTTTSIKVADVVINDDALGTNNLTLTGADAALFELQAGSTELHLKAGVVLDFETNPVLDVNIVVDDPGIGSTSEDTVAFSITILDAHDVATGIPEIQGMLVVGQTLTVDTSNIADQDGLGVFAYQWIRGGSNIVGAESATYMLTAMDAGQVIRIAVRFEDGGGHSEGPLVSAPTTNIASANIAPTLDNFDTNIQSNETKVFPTLVFSSLANDPEDQPLSAILVTPPLVGTLDLLPTGDFTYTPPVDFVGRVTFQWKANDGDLDSNVATVTLDVIAAIPVAAPPPSAPADGAGNRDNVSNVEPDSSNRQSTDDAIDSGSDNSIESSGQADDSARATPLPASNRESNTTQTQSDEANQAAIVMDLATKNTSDNVVTPVGGSEVLIAQLSETFVQRSDRTSRDSTSHNDGTTGFIDDSQTRSLVMADYALMTRPGEMWEQLDNYQQNINSRIQGDLIVVGSAGAAASSFTVGVVAWAMRSGFLVSGLIAHMPAWSGVDPLLILQGVTGGSAAGSAGNETLEQLMDRQNKQVESVEE